MLKNKEDTAPQAYLEGCLVNITEGTCVVINGCVAGVSDDRCLHSQVTLTRAAFVAADVPLDWEPAVTDRTDYLSRLGAQYGISKADALQQVLDRGCLRQHHSRVLRTLEAKLRQPHVTRTLIGGNIRRKREACGLTVEDLADRSDLDPLEVEAFEEGCLIIFAEQLVQLVGALGLESPERLLEAV